MLNRKINSIIIFFLFFIIFGIGFFVGKFSVVCDFCEPEEVNFSLFWEAWRQVEDKYVDIGDVDREKMVRGAISGMVSSIGDPYTVFFDPEETKVFYEDASGQFEGVGMEIGIRDGVLQIISPLKGTPAEKAGLRAGDKIFKIDDYITNEMKIEEAVSFIRGQRGTSVTLTVYRDGWDLSREFEIKRDVIKIPSLELDFLSNEEISHIKLFNFSEKSSNDFSEAAIRVLNSSAKGIILDLRNNPGGYLDQAEKIANWFLEEGQVIVVGDYGGRREKEYYKARGNGKLTDYPIVILINQGSASASEILASAIRDNLGSKIVGEKSFGKGSVQEMTSLSDGSSIKISVAKWLTPNGDLITNVGLMPDVVVEKTEEDHEAENDPQLDRAIELIKEII